MISSTTDLGLALANDLRPILLRVARELRKETEQFGVTARQVTLLSLVKRSPGLTLKALAEAEAISAPALSGHIDRLERAGLLVRVRSAVDRRRVGLELTPEGERLLRSVRARRTAWLAERLSALEPDALQAIEAAIEPLQELLGENP
jgi:DNA-binding MarR family transcriptional regulator